MFWRIEKTVDKRCSRYRDLPSIVYFSVTI